MQISSKLCVVYGDLSNSNSQNDPPKKRTSKKLSCRASYMKILVLHASDNFLDRFCSIRVHFKHYLYCISWMANMKPCIIQARIAWTLICFVFHNSFPNGLQWAATRKVAHFLIPYNFKYAFVQTCTYKNMYGYVYIYIFIYIQTFSMIKMLNWSIKEFDYRSFRSMI